MEIKSLAEINVTAHLRLVLLDLDNTLYSYKKCHAPAIEAVFNWLGPAFNLTYSDCETKFLDARKKVHQMLHGTAAGHSRFFYFQLMLEKQLGYTDYDAILKCDELYWETFINNMTLYDDASFFLNECVKNNTQVIIVSDMLAAIQFKKMKKLGLTDIIKLIVTSEEAGIEKPSPSVYLYAIEKSKQVFGKDDFIAVVGDDAKKDTFQSNFYSVKEYLLARDE